MPNFKIHFSYYLHAFNCVFQLVRSPRVATKILHELLICYMRVTELRSRVVNTSASYSGGAGFKSRFGLRFFFVFLVPPGGRIIQRPLPSISFPIHHLSPFQSTLYGLSY
jgi:hypothetical protein